MTESLTKNEEIERNEIAARLIVRHIGRLNEAWHEIDALNSQWPNAPVGTTWRTFRSIADHMNALIKTWDKIDG